MLDISNSVCIMWLKTPTLSANFTVVALPTALTKYGSAVGCATRSQPQNEQGMTIIVNLTNIQISLRDYGGHGVDLPCYVLCIGY